MQTLAIDMPALSGAGVSKCERCGCMGRRRIYRISLILALILSILTLFVYSAWYLKTQVPDAVRIAYGDEQTLNLGLKEVSVQAVEHVSVIPGGVPIGVYLETHGVYVVGTSEVATADGLLREPALQILQAGDYILVVNGKSVEDKDELIACIQANKTETMVLRLNREGEELQVHVNAVQTEEGDYKLGVWVKDDIQGIGTLTYMAQDGSFGALGHGITDSDTGELLDAAGGSLYDTTILDIVKGVRGTPGELSGSITYSERHVRGTILQNTEAGIFGEADGILAAELCDETVEVAFKQEVEIGTAVLRSAVSGELKDYEIEITEIRLNESDVNKGMVFRVTDEELLGLTGGVIQGMSGSPILQNGRLIGTVTHVFVNDPAKGYAIFAETMVSAGE
ncbi:MAG: SpoIVB peptidase [Lachnospiraceae bacterium]|nr:SpoIVB peptidase [Lachnospiraceae bacterium]